MIIATKKAKYLIGSIYAPTEADDKKKSISKELKQFLREKKYYKNNKPNEIRIIIGGGLELLPKHIDRPKLNKK